MFVKSIKQRNGTHYLHVVESYRINGTVKHKKIASLGILEELEKNNPNILKELKEKYSTYKISKDKYKEKNYGYFMLQAIYENIGIDNFLNKYQSKIKIDYKLNDVMQLLVYSRILNPESKSSTFINRDIFFDNFDVKINDVYRSLDIFDELKKDLQFDIHSNIQKKYGRDCTLVFYDVTNYYFEIHENDMDTVDDNEKIIEGFRKNGLGKDGKRQPLVVMGLVIDKNKIPVAYRLFKGNEADTKTLIPIFDEISKEYKLNKIIVVADKGLNSENNLNYIASHGNGYILSQKTRGQNKEFTNEILKQNYIIESGNFKCKSIIRDRVLRHETDKTKNISVKEKVVFFWSIDYYERSKHKREEELKKINHFITNQKLLVKIEKELKPYIVEKIKDKNNTELKNAKIEYEFDENKFNEACKLDGYYVIISSETDITERDIIEKYRGLSEIENSFRILKSDFEGRPVYVRNKARIEGHFLTCFIALVITRILQKLLNNQYSIAKIQEAINSAKMHASSQDHYKFSESKLFDEMLQKLNTPPTTSELISNKFIDYKVSMLYHIKKAVFS